MKPRAFKFMFFMIIIILIILAIFIIYIEKSEPALKVEGKKLDMLISNNLKIGIANFDNLNPHISKNQDVQYVAKLIYKDLIGVNEKFELIPSLAKEWSKISDKTYIIKLNENEYWHNGEKFTARDVEFTINELKSETTNSIYKENVKNIEKIEVIDDYTIKIYLHENEDFFEYNLCIPILKCNLEKEFIGTGNYKVCEVTNNYIMFQEVNDDSTPRKIKINLYNSYSELYSAFSQEKVDIITTSNINFNNFVGTIDLKEERIKGRELTYLKINMAQDENIRKAISCAINKDEIVYNIFNNKYFSADNLLDNGNYLGKINIEDNYNLNSAKEYIAKFIKKENNSNKINNESSLNINLTIKQENENHIKIAEELKKQLEEVGFVINIIELSEDVYNNNLQTNNYEIILCNDTLGLFPDIKKYINFNNAEIQELTKNIENIDDKKILKSTYEEILKKHKDENTMLCLIFDTVVLLHNSNIKGDFTGNWYNIFYNIDTWYKVL